MSKSLSITQQHAISRIQAAILNIERLRIAINQTRREHGLECRVLTIPLLGMLSHDVEGLLFEHSCALHSELKLEGGRVAA